MWGWRRRSTKNHIFLYKFKLILFPLLLCFIHELYLCHFFKWFFFSVVVSWTTKKEEILLIFNPRPRQNVLNVFSSLRVRKKINFFIFVAWMSSGHSVGLIVDSQSLSLSLTRYCFILRSFLSALNAADDDDDVDFMGISWTKEYKRCSSLPLWPRRSATLTKIFFSSWYCCYF